MFLQRTPEVFTAIGRISRQTGRIHANFNANRLGRVIWRMTRRGRHGAFSGPWPSCTNRGCMLWVAGRRGRRDNLPPNFNPPTKGEETMAPRMILAAVAAVMFAVITVTPADAGQGAPAVQSAPCNCQAAPATVATQCTPMNYEIRKRTVERPVTECVEETYTETVMVPQTVERKRMVPRTVMKTFEVDELVAVPGPTVTNAPMPVTPACTGPDCATATATATACVNGNCTTQTATATAEPEPRRCGLFQRLRARRGIQGKYGH